MALRKVFATQFSAPSNWPMNDSPLDTPTNSAGTVLHPWPQYGPNGANIDYIAATSDWVRILIEWRDFAPFVQSNTTSVPMTGASGWSIYDDPNLRSGGYGSPRIADQWAALDAMIHAFNAAGLPVVLSIGCTSPQWAFDKDAQWMWAAMHHPSGTVEDGTPGKIPANGYDPSSMWGTFLSYVIGRYQPGVGAGRKASPYGLAWGNPSGATVSAISVLDEANASWWPQQIVYGYSGVQSTDGTWVGGTAKTFSWCLAAQAVTALEQLLYAWGVAAGSKYMNWLGCGALDTGGGLQIGNPTPSPRKGQPQPTGPDGYSNYIATPALGFVQQLLRQLGPNFRPRMPYMWAHHNYDDVANRLSFEVDFPQNPGNKYRQSTSQAGTVIPHENQSWPAMNRLNAIIGVLDTNGGWTNGVPIFVTESGYAMDHQGGPLYDNMQPDGNADTILERQQAYATAYMLSDANANSRIYAQATWTLWSHPQGHTFDAGLFRVAGALNAHGLTFPMNGAEAVHERLASRMNLGNGFAQRGWAAFPKNGSP